MRRQERSLVSQKAHDDLSARLAPHQDADLAEASGLVFGDEGACGWGLGWPRRSVCFAARWWAAGREAIGARIRRVSRQLAARRVLEVRAATGSIGPHVADNPDEFRAVAQFINAATGRGRLPDALRRVAPVLNATLFAPRNLAGRFEVLNPVVDARMPRPRAAPRSGRSRSSSALYRAGCCSLIGGREDYARSERSRLRQGRRREVSL